MTSMERFLRASYTPMTNTETTPNSSLSAGEKQYVTLLADYCLTANIDDPAWVLMGGEFTVDDIDFRLKYNAKQKPDMLCVRCDYGMPPEGDEEETYLKLLHANAWYFNGMSPVMGLCPDTGHVISSARLTLKNLTAEALDSFIRAMAIEAAAWGQGRRKQPATAQHFH